ncbi:MAG: tyrosine-type recombinase/integrase [Candidatus Dormibacteraeota bacterium]|uniref:Tyrosine-type recombinase/integrase n=1 Tax=Candidatus Aeolococcus gillhamiae TaxID=3127015 RepID=A0A2W5Z396_9BACT|nr:tyrosine-type recombinase/integrase [Candidatus Dormibacteraeota bacterium]PZR79710.1 MAG: hypothetical protein DLM65_09985 [Candidatus Dormibacter sp. RRmetagenome_bin12]
MPQPAVRPQRRTSPARSRAPHGLSWNEAVERFLASKRAENLSPATLENYEWHLAGSRAKIFLADHEVISPRQLDGEMLEALQAELLAAGVSPALVHSFHRVWKNFAGFCIRRGYGADPDVLAVKAPRQPQREPDTYSAEDERRIIKAARSPRDRLLIEVLMRTGLRLEEVAHLSVDDVIDGPEGAYLRVRQGKGAKDRVVPLDTGKVRLSKKLRDYIRHARPATDGGSSALFLSQRSRGGVYEPLTGRAVQLVMRRISMETGIRVHPHKFRHTFATRALSAGVDVMALQRVLGHTTLAMVSRYVHYQKADLLEAWKKRSD